MSEGGAGVFVPIVGPFLKGLRGPHARAQARKAEAHAYDRWVRARANAEAYRGLAQPERPRTGYVPALPTWTTRDLGELQRRTIGESVLGRVPLPGVIRIPPAFGGPELVPQDVRAAVYAAAPSPAGGTGTTGQPPSGGGGVDWRRILYDSYLVAQLVAYLRGLFQKVPTPRYSFNFGGLLGGGDLAGAGGGGMPYNFNPSPMPVPGGWDPYGGGLFGGLGSGIASIIQAIRGPASMPGGAFGFLGSTQGGAGDVAGMLMGQQGGCPTAPFRAASASGVRAQPFIATHPVTGAAVWFRPAGKPILWTGDLSACRRVRKIAGRARRRLGGR